MLLSVNERKSRFTDRNTGEAKSYSELVILRTGARTALVLNPGGARAVLEALSEPNRAKFLAALAEVAGE